MPEPRIDAIGVVAADMTATVAFYRRVGVTFEAGADGEDHAEGALAGGMRLMVDTEESIRGMYPDWSGVSGDRVAFAAQLESPAEVDALYGELAVEGFGVRPPWDAPWGHRYCTVRDPDGVPVDLYAVAAS